MDTNNATNSSEDHTIEVVDHIGPDYIVMQYRQIRFEDGWRTRKERIGAAFNNANGSICLRLSGQQIIAGDIYLFPQEGGPE